MESMPFRPPISTTIAMKMPTMSQIFQPLSMLYTEASDVFFA